MSDQKVDDAIKGLDAFEVDEIDDKDLDAVAGGVAALEEAGCLNGNCNGCSAGSLDPNGCSNANCTPK